MSEQKIPVFLDTDIGSDIDDTWALAMMLNSPEIELRQVLTTTGDSRYRAKIVAKMLDVVGNASVGLSLGGHVVARSEATSKYFHKQQAAWVEDYDLASYGGVVREDGVQAFVEGIMACEGTPLVVSIGPLTNVAAALALEPGIARKCRFLGMHGSVRLGYFGSPEVSGEYNVVFDPASARAVLEAPWVDTLITPLDTCGYITLDGPRYHEILHSASPLAQAVIDNYRNWRHDDARHWRVRSSLLCDTVAAYLSCDEALATIETLPIYVDDRGWTLIDEEKGHPIRVATGWRDFEAFKQFIVDRLVQFP